MVYIQELKINVLIILFKLYSRLYMTVLADFVAEQQDQEQQEHQQQQERTKYAQHRRTKKNELTEPNHHHLSLSLSHHHHTTTTTMWLGATATPSLRRPIGLAPSHT